MILVDEDSDGEKDNEGLPLNSDCTEQLLYNIPKIPDDFDKLLEEKELVSHDDEAFVTTYEASALMGSTGMLSTDVDLYDSGATCHMSGFRHRFINFVEIDPKPITAADKRTFSATGQGDIQWLKKMSQCLHDFERSDWCELMT